MPVTTTLGLADGERAQLAGILECSESELDATLSTYAHAALEEYARMFIGQRVFTRGSDIREYRLFLLIKTAFGNELPDEQRVCSLFQTTITQSRSLIRSVMSKYQYELQDAIDETLKSEVAGATRDGDDWVVIVHSENIVEALNRVIGTIDGSLPQIEKKRGTVAGYVMKPSAYLRLCQHYSLPAPD
jgi:hypothetical protein